MARPASRASADVLGLARFLPLSMAIWGDSGGSANLLGRGSVMHSVDELHGFAVMTGAACVSDVLLRQPVM
jgi:hypothetical protein